MSRILACCDGAEFGDFLYWDSYNGLYIDGDYPAGGEYAYRIGANGSAAKDLPSALAEFWLRFKWRVESAGTSDVFWIWRVFYSNTPLLGLKFNMLTAQLEIWSPSDLLAVCSGFSLEEEQYYMVEVHLKLHDTTGEVDVRLDSIDIGSYDGDTVFTAYSSCNALQWLTGLSNTSTWVDDIALDDAGFPGLGSYLLLRAAGNGDVSQFTGSDGNSTDNYLLVDDIPPDGDDTYIEDSTTGHQDMVTVDDYDGTDLEVLRVWCEVRARGTAPSGESLKLGVKTHSTVYVSAAVDLLESYRRRIGDELAVNPNTSSQWTESELDVVQAVVEVP